VSSACGTKDAVVSAAAAYPIQSCRAMGEW
jgi:hypothetical protein